MRTRIIKFLLLFKGGVPRRGEVVESQIKLVDL